MPVPLKEAYVFDLYEQETQDWLRTSQLMNRIVLANVSPHSSLGPSLPPVVPVSDPPVVDLRFLQLAGCEI